MSLFTIDQDRCHRDRICPAECPLAIIEVRGENRFPRPVQGAEELCIRCGHCVAVFPHAGLSLETIRPEDCLPVLQELDANPAQIEQFLPPRRSIRSYQPRRVDRQILTRLMEIACSDPSGRNLHPVHWLVVEDPHEVRRLSRRVVEWMRVMLKERPDLAAATRMERNVSAWERGEDRICHGAPI